MPLPAALGADLVGLRTLRRTATAMTTFVLIGRPWGAAPPPSAAPPTSPAPIDGARSYDVACSCPCSVELPGEIA
jgi:hypothetical protein